MNIFETAKSVSILDIAASIHGLQPEKQGSQLVGLCPFHADTKPSGTFYLETNSFHCFGCGATGSGIDYVIKSGLATTPKEAAEYIVKQWGLAVDNKCTKKAERPKKAEPFSLAEYAEKKKLPVDFLKDLGVKDGNDEWGKDAVITPYKLEDGSPGPVRYRYGWSRKDFKWQKGSKICLYGLDKLAGVVSGQVILVEGESDSQTLWLHGYQALGVPGAGNFKPEWTKLLFKFGKVYLHQEPDEAGQVFVTRIAGFLKESGYEGQILVFTTPGHKDPSELHQANPDEFNALFDPALAAAEEFAPEKIGKVPAATAGGTTSKTSTTPVADDFTLTDVGNGLRFVSIWGNDVRFNPAREIWLLFDDIRWVLDEVGRIMQLAKVTVRKIYADASAEPDDFRCKMLVNHATRSESISRLEAMLKAASTEDNIPVLPDQFDYNPWLLNVLNGTVDLQTGELLPHNRNDLITKLAPVVYDPDAACPMWTEFLEKIMEGNDNLIDFLQRACGYGLTSMTSEQVLFILHGTGANGKSTFVESVAHVMGDYAISTPIATFTVKRGDAIPNDVARLQGARFVSACEAEQSSRLAESLVKQLTGGDKITARYLHHEFFDFTPRFKAFLSTNHKPAIRGTDNAIWRRIRLIPFAYTVPEDERDRHLIEKLREESSGIFMWMLAGCLKWQRIGLGAPDEVLHATNSYRQEMDVLSDFIDECCIVNPIARAPAGDLYKAYSEWAERNGEYVLTRRQLSSQLSERGFVNDKGTHGWYFWKGLGLRAKEIYPTGVE
jgi:putative DNA primase/helicase